MGTCTAMKSFPDLNVLGSNSYQQLSAVLSTRKSTLPSEMFGPSTKLSCLRGGNSLRNAFTVVAGTKRNPSVRHTKRSFRSKAREDPAPSTSEAATSSPKIDEESLGRTLRRAFSSLKFEQRAGCPNSRGQHKAFSDFAATEFRSFAAAHLRGRTGSLGSFGSQWDALADAFESYDRLGGAARATLIKDALTLLKAAVVEVEVSEASQPLQPWSGQGAAPLPPADPPQPQGSPSSSSSPSECSTSGAQEPATQNSLAARATPGRHGTSFPRPVRSSSVRPSHVSAAQAGASEVAGPPPGTFVPPVGGGGMGGVEKEEEAGIALRGGEMVQGSDEWHKVRKRRLTASAFANAGGLFEESMQLLWEEKVGLRDPPTQNDAMRWGTKSEAGAIERYSAITGNSVRRVGFQVYREGELEHSWLGASPDGLLESPCPLGSGEGGAGVLEVKCPYNRGRPEEAQPYPKVPYYYMPQAQGLLEIFDRGWMDFYVWTRNSSVVFRVERDPAYWALLHGIMAEFWWKSVVPAKRALQGERSRSQVEKFRPQLSPHRAELIYASERLAAASIVIWKEERGQTYKKRT